MIPFTIYSGDLDHWRRKLKGTGTWSWTPVGPTTLMLIVTRLP